MGNERGINSVFHVGGGEGNEKGKGKNTKWIGLMWEFCLA